METQPTPTITPHKSRLPYFIGAGLIILLAAAAFIAVRYFVQPGNMAALGPGPRNVVALKGSGGEQQMFALNLKPAVELPGTRPVEAGMFVERKDNSIFIGTGEVRVLAKGQPGEAPKIDSSFSGPKVEVVISADTVIYKDTTEFDKEDPGAEVQQTVELSTIDEITDQSEVTVWGRKAGDRIIAEVILFSTPFTIFAPKERTP